MTGAKESRSDIESSASFSLPVSKSPVHSLPAGPMAIFGRKKTTVGLDIGSGLIKVAVIDHSKREPELVRVAVTPLLADAIVEGEVMDPGIVADAVQAALSSAGID